MNSQEISTLATSWTRLQELQKDSEVSDDLMSAGIQLDLLILDEPESSWAVIMEIISNTADEWVLTNLAAGPIESLLAQHGDVAINWIEAAAKKDEGFRVLLEGVWKNCMSDGVWSRLKRISETK